MLRRRKILRLVVEYLRFGFPRPALSPPSLFLHYYSPIRFDNLPDHFGILTTILMPKNHHLEKSLQVRLLEARPRHHQDVDETALFAHQLLHEVGGKKVPALFGASQVEGVRGLGDAWRVCGAEDEVADEDVVV